MSNSLLEIPLVFYTPSMVYGPLRIILLVTFVFFLNRLVSSKSSNQLGLDYFIPRYLAFVCSIVMLGFLLIQINAYDTFTVLVVLLLFMLFKLLNLKRKKALKPQLRKIRSRTVLYAVKSLEQQRDLISVLNFKKKGLQKDAEHQVLSTKQYYWQLALVIFIGVATYASRYYFFNFDTFALSDLWYQDFSKIKSLYGQHWLANGGILMGEYALIQTYAALTDISDVIALQTFGLLENAVLSIVIFWMVSKITKARYIPGLIAALVFIFFYAFLPLNINLMTQHKSTFLALSLALPAFVYLIRPSLLRISKRSYFYWMLLFFLGIAFIDLFVSLVILPLMILSALIWAEKENRSYSIKALLAFGIATVTFLIVYGGFALYKGASIYAFLRTSLYSFTNYTYVPQLILPLDTLLLWYQIGLSILLGISILLYFRSKETLKYQLPVLTFSLVIFLLPSFAFDLIDPDLLLQVISVLIPICTGIAIYMVFFIIQLVVKLKQTPIYVRIGMAIAFLYLTYISLDQNALLNYPKRNLTNEYIIEAYDAMHDDLLPYSYSVVNSNMATAMSIDSHFFITYDNFIKQYPKADSIYVANRKDLSYFRENPNAMLSKSTFVFVYAEKAKLNKNEVLEYQEQQQALEVVENLKLKGRKVEVFFKRPLITVYELVNEPEATKINDLLF